MESPNPFRAIQPAIATMSSYLFKPFKFERWAIMGLLSYLMMCGGQGSVGIKPRGLGGGHHGPGRFSHPHLGGLRGLGGDPGLAQALTWLHDHAGLITLLVVCAIAFAAVATLLTTWLSSRAAFTYLDNLTG